VTVEATYEEVVTGVTLELDANTARLLTALLAHVNLDYPAATCSTDCMTPSTMPCVATTGWAKAMPVPVGQRQPLPVIWLRPVGMVEVK